MLDQDVAPVIGELGVFDLADGDLELLAEAVPKAAHGWRAVFPDLGRGERGPARFAVAGLGDQDDLRAEFEERAGGLGLAGFGEGEQDHVEGPRHFAQQVKDADRAAVGERVGEIGREHGDSGAIRENGRPSSRRWAAGAVERSRFQGQSQRGRRKMRSRGTPRRKSQEARAVRSFR